MFLGEYLYGKKFIVIFFKEHGACLSKSNRAQGRYENLNAVTITKITILT